MTNKLNGVLKFHLLFTISLTPLLSASFGFGFEQIKVAFFLISTLLCSLNFIYLLSEGQLKFSWSRIKFAGGLFILCLLVTSFTGVDPWNSIIGIHPYFQGFILFLFLFLFALMVATVKIELKYWALAASFSASLVSLRAMDEFLRLHFLSQDIPNYAGRVISSFGQPNFYSGFLVLTLPLFYLVIKDQKFQYWLMGAGVLSIAAILISGSRAALTVLVILIFGWLLATVYKSKNFISKILLHVFLTLTVLIYLPSLISKEFILSRSNKTFIDNTAEKRIYIWPPVAEFILKRPFLGYGLENLKMTFPTYERFHGDRPPTYYSIKDLVVDRSHSYTLDLLFFSGILGLSAWGLLILLVLHKAMSNKILLTSLIIYLIWVQLQNQSVAHLMYFWFLIGLIDKESTY